MSAFLTTLSAVAILLLTAAPGFLLIKKKFVGDDLMAGLSKLLMYICQPCLAVYTFDSAKFSTDMLLNMLVFLLLAIAIHVIILGGAFLLFKKKFREVAYRILVLATAFANCGFFGIPIIEALLPESASGLIIYTTIYSTVMNLLGWTVGSAIISGDTKYISLKKAIFNPTMLGVVIAIPIFVFSIELPGQISDMITILARSTTPISMLIIGMRLATTKFKNVFLQVKTYIAVAAKGFLMPVWGFMLVYFLPISVDVKITFFIICACPTASIVLNFSELIGEGQKEAAASVLLSTILSILTLPVMVLLIPLL